MNDARPRLPWRVSLRAAAAVVLTAWTAGLVVAAVQLDAWNDELARTLLQIRADAVFRTRMAEAREPIPREWYRSKTLALLKASESLQDDTAWALFVPGSWQRFDGLRTRVALRIERAFADIAVETVRRELYYRASQVTGVAQDAHSAELLVAGGCAPAAASIAAPAAHDSGTPRQPAELIAVQNQLAALEELDRAVQAMLSLQKPAAADPEKLRLLVRFTLGVELPGQLSRSTAFFRTVLKPEEVGFAADGVPRLQEAARCSLTALMKSLDTRLFERDDLLATEAYLAQRAVRLFTPAARAVPFAQTVEGYREVIAALGEQEALLAKGDYAWLRQSSASLGPTHDAVLARIARIGLLGPEAAESVRRESAKSVQRFRHQFGMVFGSGSAAALQWEADKARLALSPERLALRDGLAALLQEPYMSPPADHDLPVAAPAPLAWDTQRLEQALALAQTHRRFTQEILPRIPAPLRRSIAQFVGNHFAQLVQDAAVEAMSPAPPNGTHLFDAAGYRLQREHLAKVQALLGELGARPRADRLRALVARDLADRLVLAEETMWHSSPYAARLEHFGWWQGDGSPIQQAFGAADTTTLRHLLAQQFLRFEESAREGATLLGFADASMASAPAVLRWQGTLAELKRYRAGTPDNSLAALERFLLALPPDLNRTNCADKLAAAAPAVARVDEFARRQSQIHGALVSRCAELRFAGVPAAAPAPPPQVAVPFG